MNVTLKVWRQNGPRDKGKLVTYPANGIPEQASFLEMLDIVNARLEEKGEEPITVDHDCREGICGSCGIMINGRPHGPERGITTCQLYMRKFKDGDTIVLEPFRARAFPVIKDLLIDRAACHKIIQAGGCVSVTTGAAPDAHAVLEPKKCAEEAMDAAACIGCGACVATCKNAAAMLFVSAKVSQLALLPQGGPERERRALAMVEAMDAAGFGNCTNEGECEAECPKGISLTHIARLNREYLRAKLAK